MSTPADQRFLDALASLRDALDEWGAPFMIIGGVAVIALGVPRLTVDIDATLLGANLDIDGFVNTLARHSITPRIPDAAVFAREQHVLLAVHQPSGTPVDIRAVSVSV